MTRKEALAELIAKVEAGEWIANGGGEDTWLAILDAGMQTYHAYIYEAWCRNSLDAAKALHEAVLPEWDWEISSQSAAAVFKGPHLSGPSFLDASQSPPRAWLLSILKALHSMEPEA